MSALMAECNLYIWQMEGQKGHRIYNEIKKTLVAAGHEKTSELYVFIWHKSLVNA